jgi:cytochrome c
MKIIASVLALGLLFSASVFAAPVDDLLKAKNCMACHAVDKKIVGPAYKDVAAKYKGNKDAATLLATKIQKGGSGVWGAVPMPPNAVTAAEAKLLATWVLSQK